MKRGVWVLTLLLILVSAPLRAISLANLSYLEFFRTPVGHRLSSFYLPNYPEYFVDNPVLLAQLRLPQVSFYLNNDYQLGFNTFNFAYSLPMTTGNYGVSLHYFGIKKLNEVEFVNSRPAVVGQFSIADYNVAFYYATEMKRIAFGLKTELLQRKIDKNNGWGINLSGDLIIKIKENFVLTSSLKRLLSTRIKWSSGNSEKVNPEYAAGLYYTLRKLKTQLGLSFSYYNDITELSNSVIYMPSTYFLLGLFYKTNFMQYNNEGLMISYRTKDLNFTYLFEYRYFDIRNSVMITYFWRPMK